MLSTGDASAASCTLSTGAADEAHAAVLEPA